MGAQMLTEVGKRLSSKTLKALQDAVDALRFVMADDGGGDQQPVSEAAVDMDAEQGVALQGDIVRLLERATVKANGAMTLKLIKPGWGASGFYGRDVLERDGPKVFPSGTKMFWNHPTDSQINERPERDLTTLAAVLRTPAKYDDHGPDGPGLYAEAQAFPSYQESIKAMAPDIGVSIAAGGNRHMGTAEGRKGWLVDSLGEAYPNSAGMAVKNSVDFVTYPGADGKVLALFEAAGRSPQNQEEVNTVDEKEAQALREANDALKGQVVALEAEAARFREAAVLTEARAVVVEVLSKEQMPDMTRARLTETLAARPVITDGKLDNVGYEKVIREAAKAELAYLATVTGSGRVTGMGAAPTSQAPAGATNLKESLVHYYRAQGKSKEEAEQMAAIAAE